MTIDTKIEGDPQKLQGVAQWFRDSLKPAVSGSADKIYANRNRAVSGWHGSAGEAFGEKMSTAGRKTDDLAAAILRAAEGIDAYAAELQRAQDEMRSIRRRAGIAGLTVVGEKIEHPGEMPVSPGDPPEGPAATPLAMAAHEDSVAAADAHASKIAAYNQARSDSDLSKHLLKVATDALVNVRNDITQKWFLVVGDLASGAAGTLAAKHSSILRGQSNFLKGESVRLMESARTAPAGTSASMIYRDIDAGRSASYAADDVTNTAKNVDSSASKWGFRAGGALAVAGVAYDIHNGKPVDQAVVSGGVGFGASVAAGAAIGTMIPVPVLGTAVGAVGGAAVGVFASGVVDSIWQNGIGDVGGAVEDGAEAVGNTGKAIGGLAEDAWNAVF